jgi:hypothetical protein
VEFGRSLRRGWVAATAAFGIVLFAGLAEAQRVAVARPAESDTVLLETFNRLTAELRLQHFDVTIVDTQDARSAGALAIVFLVRTEGRTAVDVSFDERSGVTPTVRRLEPAAGTELPSVLAIRAVDLLRVNLREFRRETPPEIVRIDRPAMAEVPAPIVPVPAPRPWEIRAEAIVLYDNAALGPAFGAGLGLAHYATPSVRIGVLVTGPIITATWETADGSAFLRQHLGWAEIRLSWWRSQWLDLGASAASGVHYLSAQGGTTRPPLLPQDDHVWSFAGAIGADGSFRLTSNTGLSLTLRAIGLAPKAGVGVGRNTTVLQFPLLSASAGLLVGF